MPRTKTPFNIQENIEEKTFSLLDGIIELTKLDIKCEGGISLDDGCSKVEI